MRVEELEVSQYRNIEQLTLTCPEELHLFIGANAQGKTNLLEALYVLALGKSHRARSHRELIRWNRPVARLAARIRRGDRHHRLEVRLSERGKQVVRNGVEQRRLSEYIGTLAVVLFAPEDLDLVKGSPQIRRRFIDTEIGQISPAYVYHLTRYNKLISQRNHLLKAWEGRRQAEKALLDVLDEQWIESAVPVWRKRFEFVRSLSDWAGRIHRAISRGMEELKVCYAPSVDLDEESSADTWKEQLRQELSRIREQEIRRGITLIGPHRDDLRLSVNGFDLFAYGSQGQQRTAALALKLAEIELIHREIGHYPILLLDDVLSELDDHRKTHLLETIRDKVQTFVTATSLEGIGKETLERARIWRVEGGTFTELR